MNQKLITKKRNKINLAKKLYPNKHFKLINEKEFYNFLTKDKKNLIQEAIAS